MSEHAIQSTSLSASAQPTSPQAASAPALPPGLDDTAPHILVVDDDRRIRDLLKAYLQRQGLRVSLAENGEMARRALRGLSFDLLVVDWMMPGEDGVSLTRDLRSRHDVPVLMLTAKDGTESRIEGLEAGADDYLAKPFDPRELMLRISAILRRSTASEQDSGTRLVFGPFTYEAATGALKRSGETVHLTEREQEIMAIFAARSGETVPRYELVPEGIETGERTIDVQINRLRRKIENDPANPVHLQTVRGIGYRLAAERS